MTVYDPFGWKRHGYGLSQIKQWRTQQHDAGKPSGLDDFLMTHGLCVHCHAAGRTISGVRWRDSSNIEHSVPIVEGGSETVASLSERELKDALESDYTYAVCNFCGGSGKSTI